MSLVKPPYKTFLIPLTVSTLLVLVFFTIYYFTKGGFFDGVLLTFIGISSTFFILVLSVVIFKVLSDLLVRKSYRILGAIIAFVLTLGFTSSIILGVFKLVIAKVLF